MFRFYGFRIVKHVRSNYHSNAGKHVKGESHFTEEHQGSNFCDSFLCTVVSVGCRLLSQGPPSFPTRIHFVLQNPRLIFMTEHGKGTGPVWGLEWPIP